MLVIQLPRISSFRPSCRRYLSQSSQTYPIPNLRAFPFKFSPADAVIRMGPYASACFLFRGIFGSLAARLLPGFGFQPLQPTRIIPVYFPAWIIDAEIDVEFSCGNHDTKRRSIVTMFDSYVADHLYPSRTLISQSTLDIYQVTTWPFQAFDLRSNWLGSDYKVLSSVPLLSRPLKISTAVPFSEELRHQHNAEVSCLPYTISPFAVLDIAASLSFVDAKVDDDLRFTSTSITPNLLAAFPVLVPLYLAHYEYPVPGIPVPCSLTMFIEAYANTGRIMTEQYGPLPGSDLRRLMPRAPKKLVEFVDDAPVPCLNGPEEFFLKMAGLLALDRSDLADKAHLWLENILTEPGTAAKLASKSSVSALAEDPRVREYTRQERRANMLWMKLGLEIASVKLLAETIADAEIPSAFVQGKLMGSAVSGLESRIQGLETKRAESLPKWWRTWKETSEKAQSRS